MRDRGANDGRTPPGVRGPAIGPSLAILCSALHVWRPSLLKRGLPEAGQLRDPIRQLLRGLQLGLDVHLGRQQISHPREVDQSAPRREIVERADQFALAGQRAVAVRGHIVPKN